MPKIVAAADVFAAARTSCGIVVLLAGSFGAPMLVAAAGHHCWCWYYLGLQQVCWMTASVLLQLLPLVQSWLQQLHQFRQCYVASPHSPRMEHRHSCTTWL
ncbi:hypothetical protein PanWU01x14_111360 [Parasponia andersonii]|uniref:Uncharacterized protein n=1 Tax=Parasponia andersonii TaxID=3476 RepID=A0A2P5CZ15_PARAD|nr:hypothetical protein PanWU01x14_111360 [Parasponia andersonii]